MARPLAALLALGLLWRVTRYALCFPFWGDEAYLNINYLRRGFAELIQPLEYAQIAPLLYLWMQKTVCLVAGGGEYALRVTALLAGLAALLLFWRLAARELPATAALFAVGLLAASYGPVRHGAESKPYAFDLLVATALLWAASLWQSRPEDRRWALLTAAAAVVGIWLSYPAIFVVAGVGLVALLTAARAACRPAWLGTACYAALAIASFALFYITFARPHVAGIAGGWLEEYWEQGFPPRTGGISAWLRWLWEAHTGHMFAYPLGGSHSASLATTVLSSIGAVWLLRARRAPWLLLLLAPAAFALFAAILRKYPYGGALRVSLYLGPTICLLTGAGAGALTDRIRDARVRTRVIYTVSAVLGLICLIGLARDALRPYKSLAAAATRRLARELSREVGAAPVAIINPPYGTYAPPEGPKFEQTLRYYLLLNTRREPLWWYPNPRPDQQTAWVLAYVGPEGGPPRERVIEQARAIGLRVLEEREYLIEQSTATAVHLYRCAPSAGIIHHPGAGSLTRRGGGILGQDRRLTAGRSPAGGRCGETAPHPHRPDRLGKVTSAGW